MFKHSTNDSRIDINECLSFIMRLLIRLIYSIYTRRKPDFPQTNCLEFENSFSFDDKTEFLHRIHPMYMQGISWISY